MGVTPWHRRGVVCAVSIFWSLLLPSIRFRPIYVSLPSPAVAEREPPGPRASVNSAGDTSVDFTLFKIRQREVDMYCQSIDASDYYSDIRRRALTLASASDVWRSFSVRRAKKEKSSVVSNSERTCANAGSVDTSVRACAIRTRDVIEPFC
jgi:hypothetical protein